MKEKPILFNGAMVRSILAGSKTQTRRVVTVHWHKGRRCQPYSPYFEDADGQLLTMDEYGDYHEFAEWVRTYYTGQQLWVRETWAQPAYSGRDLHTDRPIHEVTIVYRADGASRQIRLGEHEDSGRVKADGTLAWRPSIHMPRWASRITLEVTDVQVERVQDISEEDLGAEGVSNTAGDLSWRLGGGWGEGSWWSSPREAFEKGWDSINGKKPGRAWTDNPWVWAVSFRKVGDSCP